ncbi:hypothetical protein MYX84_11685, partial [Acidobacteria bacterium AH-259-O06]|nr:hypothetical protein [Acidobacteria bacterium AH-259-O06]
MQLSQIPDVRLEGGGVMFKYLVFDLELAGEKKTILRALNYQPYLPNMEEQIIKATKEELEESGFFESGGDFKVGGGASMAFNLYYETITLFGNSQSYGAENNREAAAKMMESAFPEH